MGIKLLSSSPYYAQANGQAEASNKIMIKIIQKKIYQKPCGLNEWLLMELHRHLLMSCLWTSCYFTMGDEVRLEEINIAKGFKFQGLQ
jgi:hypothetical protein